MTETGKWVAGFLTQWTFAIAGAAYCVIEIYTPLVEQVARTSSDNEHLRSQVATLKAEQASMRKSLDDGAASSQKTASDAGFTKGQFEQCLTQLQDARAQIGALTKQSSAMASIADTSRRCSRYEEAIEEFRLELQGRTFQSMGHPPTPERRAEINAQIADQQKTLQACITRS